MTTRNEGNGGVAVITGGASGIGLATATLLAERGWQVVIGDLDPDRCEAAAKPIGATAIPFDVTDEHAVEAAIAEAESRLGPVEALMANAGLIQPATPPEDFALADFDRVVAVNLRGVYVSCVAAGKRMARRGRGGIVITGSVTASRAVPLHAYSPTKAAVVHMAACLAAEWGRSGVRVNAVSPGYVGTPPVLAAIQRGQRDPAQLREAAAMGRMVEPAEIARAVAFLLSEDASAITGINLPVDAGWPRRLAHGHLQRHAPGSVRRRVSAPAPRQRTVVLCKPDQVSRGGTPGLPRKRNTETANPDSSLPTDATSHATPTRHKAAEPPAGTTSLSAPKPPPSAASTPSEPPAYPPAPGTTSPAGTSY